MLKPPYVAGLARPRNVVIVLPVPMLLEGLDLTAVNVSKIPYKGYAEVRCSFGEPRAVEITVPMWLTEEDQRQPIIGYNVIEELIQCNQGQDSEAIEGEEQLLKVMTAAFPTDSDNLGTLRIIKKDITIPNRTTIDVVCRANTGTVEEQIPVLFEPAEERGQMD